MEPVTSQDAVQELLEKGYDLNGARDCMRLKEKYAAEIQKLMETGNRLDEALAAVRWKEEHGEYYECGYPGCRAKMGHMH